MKKTLLVLMSVAFLFTANAQEGGFKQAAGDKAFEVNFAPLGGNPVSIAGIQLKSYSSETSAFRINIFVGNSSDTKITQQAIDTFTTASMNSIELKEKNSSLEIGLRPGIEKHFAGTDRLSPYVGAELDFALKFSTKTEEFQYNGKTGTEAGSMLAKTTKGEDGFLRVGLNLVAGFDYFLAKKLYIGAEFGFGLSMKNKSKIKVEDEFAKQQFTDASPSGTYPGILDEKQGKTMNIGPNVNSQIRVGFLF